MREMSDDFLVESETEIKVSEAVKNDMPAKKMQKTKVEDDMAVTDCNDCVLQSIGLAQAFVPFQPNANTMELAQSLVCGTAFKDLVQPYVRGSHLKPKS